jgi:hypothetical protein
MRHHIPVALGELVILSITWFWKVQGLNAILVLEACSQGRNSTRARLCLSRHCTCFISNMTCAVTCDVTAAELQLCLYHHPYLMSHDAPHRMLFHARPLNLRSWLYL